MHWHCPLNMGKKPRGEEGGREYMEQIVPTQLPCICQYDRQARRALCPRMHCPRGLEGPEGDTGMTK